MPNNLSFANAVLRPTLRTQARMSGLAKPRNWLLYSKAVAEMHRFLRKSECQRFVVSAEALCFARTAEEARWIQGLFKSKGVEIVPVVCFRGDTGWRESWHDYLRRWDPEQRQSYGEGTDDVRGD